MSVLLLVIAIAGVSILYNQINVVSKGAVSEGTEALISVTIAPKILAVSCLDNYGYVFISTDELLRGKVHYTVKYGLDEVISGFSDVDVNGVGKIYFNASMTEGQEYRVKITARSWSLDEACTSSKDPGLMLFLPFSEGSGTTAKDWSLNGNDASLNASWVNGTSDYAIRFDGLNEYAKVDSTTGFNADEFTLAFWALREYSSADNEAFVEGGSFHVRSMSDDNIDFGLSGGSTISLSMENRSWTHFTMRYDGSTLSIFKNCSLAQSTSSSYSPTMGDFYMGKGSSEYIAGSIDEVYFFSRALEDDEIPAFCQPKLTVQGNAYNGTWYEEDGYCPPEDPEDPDCLMI
jgi:hypothetical protein